jgi:YHS domain-containing protein
VSSENPRQKAKRGVVRFLTLVLVVVLVAWAIWLIRRVRFWMGYLTGRPMRTARPSSPPKPEVALRRDPVCGMFVSPEISLTLEHSGQVHHFCSAACRDRFVSSLPRAASV